MAMRRFPRRRSGSRLRTSNKRRYRWIVVAGNFTVPAGTFQAVDLLSPVIPAASLADLTYQQMTNPTIIAVMGHVTVQASRSYSLASTDSRIAPYAWGLYVDKDISSSGTSIPPYSLAYTSTWMMWESGTVVTPGIIEDGVGRFGFFNDTDHNYRRYRLNQRRYKRKFDSYNDTFKFVFENASDGAANDMSMTVSTFFRMLFLE